MPNEAAGLYPDPSRPNVKGSMRYWNGVSWLNHEQTPEAFRADVHSAPLEKAELEKLRAPEAVGEVAGPSRSNLADRKPMPPSKGIGSFVVSFIAGALVWGVVLYFAQLGTVVWVITTLVAASITGLVIRGRDRKTAEAVGGGNSGNYSGLSFDATTIRYSGQQQPIKGVAVVVETAGSLSKRLNVSNMLIGGVLLGPVGLILGATDKVDDSRELYLLVTGTERQWAVKVKPNEGAIARKFAARINTAGMSA